MLSDEWLLTFEKKLAYKTSKQCDENGTGNSDEDNQGYSLLVQTS